MRTSAEFFQEFYEHTVNDYGIPYILLKDEAVRMLKPVFENWPFLKEAINTHNKYRISVSKDDFDLFFVPAIKRLCNEK